MIDIDESQQVLKSIFETSKDKHVKGAAEAANQYTDYFKLGKLEKSEYIQLMNFVIDTNNINRTIKNIKQMDSMNDTIVDLIQKVGT